MSPPFQLPDVDAIVVNRDGGDAVFAALRSLEAQQGIDLSIVLVDNGSAAEERERIAREFPEVRLVPFSRNLGFAGAANEGIARTRSPFVLLLNNDAVLAPDYVARITARLALDARLAAVQGLVLSADGARIDTAGLEWNSRGEALPLLGGAPRDEAPAGVIEVAGVSATAVLYRRDALEMVASQGEVFEPSFFAYYEDVDLSLRLARAGWRFACEPAATARHEGSRTGARTPWKRAKWIARNRWTTLDRNFDRGHLLRNATALLRADVAHARALGWRAPALLFSIWPRLLFARIRPAHAAGSAKLRDWPSAGGNPPTGSAAARDRRLAG